MIKCTRPAPPPPIRNQNNNSAPNRLSVLPSIEPPLLPPKIKVKSSNQNDTLFDAQLENICANKILLNHFKRDMGPSRKKSQSVKSKFTYL